MTLPSTRTKTAAWKTRLQDKETRDAYVDAQHTIGLSFQVWKLRQARGWTREQLAERSGIPKERIVHIEEPGRDPLTIQTLKKLASAFDVGLLVQFVPFSQLVRHEKDFHLGTFDVVSFDFDEGESKRDTVMVMEAFRKSASLPETRPRSILLSTRFVDIAMKAVYHARRRVEKRDAQEDSYEKAYYEEIRRTI